MRVLPVFASILGLGALVLMAAPANATLHGFCGTSFAATTCADNNTISPTSQDPLTSFGFHESSSNGLSNPDIVVDFLIPDNAVGASSETISVTGTHTGVTTAQTLTRFSTTPWTATTQTLERYLVLSGSITPGNALSSLLGPAETYDTAAGLTGFYVYQADFGSVNFNTADPTFTTSFNLPTGSIILAFVEGSTLNSTVQDTTPSSAAIAETGGNDNGNNVPEPTSLLVFGTALVGMAAMRKRKAAL